MSKLRVLDLFAGIGGFSLGLERTGGFETVAFCEIEPYPQKVLAKHWPGVPIYDDVRTLTAERLAGDGITGIDVITGGFPCQDLSSAGNQAGIGEGTRSGLWSECARLLGELRPRYAIFENVTALLSGDNGRWFEQVLWDISQVGYDAEWHGIPASELGAPHQRERVWVIAYPSSQSRAKGEPAKADGDWWCLTCDMPIFGGCECDHGEWECRDCGEWTYPFYYDFSEGCQFCGSNHVAYASGTRGEAWLSAEGHWEKGFARIIDNGACELGRGERSSHWESEPRLARLANGIPNRSHRLKAIGNAVVPQIPELIGHAILDDGLTHAELKGIEILVGMNGG